MRTKLTDDEITRELESLPGWERRDDAIVRTFTFPTFAEGIAFVDRVARAADAADHHPDIDIRYTRVTCALSTHDAGGVTRADVRLAREIDGLVGGAPGIA
ncbi:MAG TPA: 4a-hydroxytetrahydrobiopterin dehydratase [Gemmatimonadaceae bacterium]|nr:4a-hydroxytetrahydrobiopterin dehydratase [Gemmatimonadaceae bacterium]